MRLIIFILLAVILILWSVLLFEWIQYLRLQSLRNFGRGKFRIDKRNSQDDENDSQNKNPERHAR